MNASASDPSQPKAQRAAPTTSELPAWRAWIVAHDDSKWFNFLYTGLAIVLSLWLGLFWLLAVVAVHLALELIKQHHLRTQPSRVIAWSLWELKFDLALILFSLVVLLYMDTVLGLAGLGASGRIAAQGARATRFHQVVRSILISVDDVARIGGKVAASPPWKRAAKTITAAAATTLAVRPSKPELNNSPNDQATTQNDDQNDTRNAETSRAFPWHTRWSKGDWVSIGFAVICSALLLAAPYLTKAGWQKTMATITSELHPFAHNSHHQ